MDLKRPQAFAYAYFPVADVGSRAEKYDSLFDALMHVRLSDPLECRPIARLQMIGQDVEAFRISKGVFYSVNAILARTETAESNRVAYNAIPFERFKAFTWFEYDLRDMLPADSWKPPVSSDRTVRRGCLIEREGNAFRAYHFFESPDGSFKEPTTWRIFRDSTGKVCWSLVGLAPPQSTSQDDGERIVAYLLYMTAPHQVRATPGKLSGKKHKRLDVLRLEPPWDRCDPNTGLLPVQPAAARPSRLIDILLDAMELWVDSVHSARANVASADMRVCALATLDSTRSALNGSEQFALSPLTAAAAAEIAEEERTGMELARRVLSLPFPITWLEWQNAECGLSGSRHGALIQAELGDDLQGKAQVLVITFPDPWRPNMQPFNSVPFAEFSLELGQADAPFLSMKDCTPRFEVRDADKFGRFLQAVLTFITQPRMCRLTMPSIPSNQAALERARREGGWRPLNTRVHEVHLVLDMPEEARGKEGGAVLGSGLSGKALHTVRAFWRWKLGKLEFVRPHWRGDAQFGVSRKIYKLISPSELPRKGSN